VLQPFIFDRSNTEGILIVNYSVYYLRINVPLNGQSTVGVDTDAQEGVLDVFNVQDLINVELPQK